MSKSLPKPVVVSAADDPRLCLANETVRCTIPICPRCEKGIWPGRSAKLSRIIGTGEFHLYHTDCEVL